MRVLCLDPSSKSTGFVIIEKQGKKWVLIDKGRIVEKDKTPVRERIYNIALALNLIMRQSIDPFYFQPIIDFVFWEDPSNGYYEGNVKTVMGAVAYSVFALCKANGLSSETINQKTLKAEFTGSGAANKKEIQELAQQVWKLDYLPHNDEADALALAWIWSQRYP